MTEVKDLMEKYWIWLLAAIYLLGVAVYVFANPDTLQWDFKTYYYAGLAYGQGQDPYYLRTLSTLAGQEIGFPFAYPPLTLPIFRIFSIWLDFQAAYRLYLVLKLAALGALIWLWVRHFLSGEDQRFFPLILVFGFSGAIYIDLTSGNISIFEQLGLWTAFWALRRHRTALFSGLVALVACFKITPILFLLIPLVLFERRRWKQPLAALGVWSALQAVNSAFQPQLYSNFLTLISKLDERMPHNPSVLALLRDLAQWIDERVVLLPGWIPMALFVLFALIVIWFAWRRLRLEQDSWNYRLFLICVTYAIIMPRFKNYSFILLIVPAYFLIMHAFERRINLGLLLLLLSPSIPLPFGLSTAASRLVWGYYPILIAALLWWLAVKNDRNHIHIKDKRIVAEET